MWPDSGVLRVNGSIGIVLTEYQAGLAVIRSRTGTIFVRIALVIEHERQRGLTMAYLKEGRLAFHSGVAADKSPYADWQRRIPWVKGWYTAEEECKAALTPVAAAPRQTALERAGGSWR